LPLAAFLSLLYVTSCENVDCRCDIWGPSIY